MAETTTATTTPAKKHTDRDCDAVRSATSREASTSATACANTRRRTTMRKKIDWLGVLFFLWIAVMFGTIFALNATEGWRR